MDFADLDVRVFDAAPHEAEAFGKVFFAHALNVGRAKFMAAMFAFLGWIAVDLRFFLFGDHKRYILSHCSCEFFYGGAGTY